MGSWRKNTRGVAANLGVDYRHVGVDYLAKNLFPERTDRVVRKYGSY